MFWILRNGKWASWGKNYSCKRSNFSLRYDSWLKVVNSMVQLYIPCAYCPLLSWVKGNSICLACFVLSESVNASIVLFSSVRVLTLLYFESSGEIIDSWKSSFPIIYNQTSLSRWIHSSVHCTCLHSCFSFFVFAYVNYLFTCLATSPHVTNLYILLVKGEPANFSYPILKAFQTWSNFLIEKLHFIAFVTVDFVMVFKKRL